MRNWLFWHEFVYFWVWLTKPVRNELVIIFVYKLTFILRKDRAEMVVELIEV